MTETKLDAPPVEKKKIGVAICDRCDKKIECTSKDPGHSTTLGIFHGKCLKEAYQELRDAENKKEAAAAAKKTKKEKKDE